jgi:NADH-quinone oxidoreductase subunit E
VARGAPEPIGDAASPGVEPVKPPTLDAPREGGPDDLTRIRGVGPALESMLHRMGIYHYDQIASWSPAEVAWADENLEDFRGRVTRDDWVGQAKALRSE